MLLHCYYFSGCQSCSMQKQCTTGKERRVKRWEHESVKRLHTLSQRSLLSEATIDPRLTLLSRNAGAELSDLEQAGDRGHGLVSVSFIETEQARLVAQTMKPKMVIERLA